MIFYVNTSITSPAREIRIRRFEVVFFWLKKQLPGNFWCFPGGFVLLLSSLAVKKFENFFVKHDTYYKNKSYPKGKTNHKTSETK